MKGKSNIKKEKNKSELEGKNGLLKPKKVTCSNCKKVKFSIKFVIAKQNWSKKNNWGYYTEDEKYKDQEWCGKCLRKVFYDKENYWQLVKSSKKRSNFRVYLARGEI